MALSPAEYRAQNGRDKNISQLWFRHYSKKWKNNRSSESAMIQLVKQADEILQEYKVFYSKITADMCDCVQVPYSEVENRKISDFFWRSLPRIRIGSSTYGFKRKGVHLPPGGQLPTERFLHI